MAPDDLDLVLTADLIAALSRRFDGYHFLGYGDTDAGHRKLYRSNAGDVLVLVGGLTHAIGILCDHQTAVAREAME